MEGVPAQCPTCSTAIPEGALRCPGCGRVFGEDNRCPHCHAIAAVKPAGSGFVCLACGKPRARLPGTTVLGEPDGRASLAPAPIVVRPEGGALRSTGAALIGASVVTTLGALAILGTSGLGLALALIAVVVGAAGVGTLVRGRHQADAQRAAAELEQRVLALAAKRNGDLTVTDVASTLHVTTAEADAVLTRLADGSRVTAEVDESAGVLHFVFHELRPAPPKTRVAIDETDAPAEEAAAEAQREAPKAKQRVDG